MKDKKEMFDYCSYNPDNLDVWVEMNTCCNLCGVEHKRLIEIHNESDKYEDYYTDYSLCEDCFVSGEILNIEKTQAEKINELQRKEEQSLKRIEQLENTILELKQAILTFNKVVKENE